MNRKVLALFLVAVFPLSAQNLPVPQTPQAVDESRLVTLHGTVHPLAQAANDRGRVSDSLPMQRLLLTLARPADRERDLQQFLVDAHTLGSPAYHQWLTPQQYGARFGATDADVQVVSTWLQTHGFSVARIAGNRTVLEFSGTAGQVREALHAEMHRYTVAGVDYTANSGEIVVPEAISSRVSGFAPLNTFPLTSYVERVGSATLNRASHQVSPHFTIHENNAPFYAFGPEDFATQYDVAPLYAVGINGTGVTIGIIGDGNINLALVDSYRSLFNLPADHTRMIVDGVDPGDPITPNIEGYLDAEVSGAIAPNATVNFYLASGSPFQDPLSLAALRAVEDNQASVLSVSYGQCEVLLGEAGNQLWAGLWQQAAAQGQTVFVSSGDSGPSTCAVANITNGTPQGLFSVNVNGIGSTPWNVSVGGTDFYYTDYASGDASAATLWNSTNDSARGSLKSRLVEQPWDDALGFNPASAVVQSAAGGGGVSSCSQETTPTGGALPTCIAGYAKPAWQNAPGVPGDNARDLPDVSLFASNGANLSAAPICAEAGDCAPVTSGDPQITLVGGTSVSSPSMAGVFALVNQKYGRQGQANYTLYALARQYPAVFHDITLGTNDILCPAGVFPDCTIPNSRYPFEDSYGKFAAGPGYDLASGLGSVDVNLMLTDWTKITYVSTTTTLQASPASVAHGSPVSISVAVTAGSGSGAGSAAPTGNVSLSAGSGTPILANTPLTLASGLASAHLTNLPGGTYALTAQYAGDGNFSSSTSAPVSLTVTPEVSSTALNLQYIGVAANGSNVLGVGTLVNGGQAPFGSTWVFQATPTGLATQTTGLATGTVTFSDGGTSMVVPLGSGGSAVWSPPILAVGAHSIKASYSGDASYTASTAGPVAFTVVKGNPALTATPEVQPSSFGSILGSSGTYQAGTTLVVHVLISQRGVPTTVAPTGTVTVTFGALTQTVALTVDPYLTQSLATAFVTLPNVPAGTYTLTASYSGDSNWNAASYVAPSAMTYVNATASPTITTLTLSRSSVDSSGGVTFNASVQATSSTLGAPFGEVLLYANGTLFGALVVSNGTGNTSSGSDTVPASELPYGALQVVAEYAGGLNMDPSISNPVPLTVTASDFSLTAAGRNLSIASGQSASVPVSLGGPSGAGVSVALTCTPSSPSIRCSVSPNPASFTGSGAATLTISAFTLSSAAAIPERPGDPDDRRMPSSRAAVAAAFAILLVLPNRKRRRMPMLLVALLAALFLSTGCGGSGSSSGSQAGQQTQTPAQAGNYNVVVTGAAGAITHDATVNFSVQ